MSTPSNPFEEISDSPKPNLETTGANNHNAYGATSIPFNAPFSQNDLPTSPSVDATLWERSVYVTLYAKAFVIAQIRGLRSWREFGELHRFSVPARIEALNRFSRNYPYFYGNYIMVLCVVTLFFLFFNVPLALSVFLLALIFTIVRWRIANSNTIATIGGYEIGPIQAYVALGILTLILFVFFSGSGTLFWIVIITATIVILHACFREPELGSEVFSARQPSFEV